MRATEHLIIAEKPAAAAKIGAALDAMGKPVEIKSGKGTSYFQITLFDSGEKAFIVSGAGHLYTLERNRASKGIPVFDFAWVRNRQNKRAIRFLGTIEAVARGRPFGRYVVATDYDTEGSVIGYNILRFSCLPAGGQLKGLLAKACRMKFSSLTQAELRQAWKAVSPVLDCARVEAGCTRHRVDAMFGINMSAAITNAVKSAGRGYHVFSIGRVQGPTLKEVCERDAAIGAHVPETYWEARAVVDTGEGGDMMSLESIPSSFKRESEAIALKRDCEGKTALVSHIRPRQVARKPPPPFNLAGLQREANHLFKFKPAKTLKLAEKLYLEALISYPRTDNEVIPPSIDVKALLVAVGGDPNYQADARAVLNRGDLSPSRGTKTDEAHPPILPTGASKRGIALSKDEASLLDLVTRRFLALFGPDMVWEERAHDIIAGGHPFKLVSSKLISEGWAAQYRYFPTKGMGGDPGLRVGQQLLVKKVDVLKRHTNPPPHHSEITLMGYMERVGIGTKSTRAEIIEKIKDRGYIEADPIRATALGKKIVEVFEAYLPAIVSVDMTRELEEDVEEIIDGNRHEAAIIDKTRNIIDAMLVQFKGREQVIGLELGKILEASGSTAARKQVLGTCPACNKHAMVLVKGRGKKRFVACEGYSDKTCRIILPIIQAGKIFPAGKNCPSCGYPMVKCYLKGRQPWEFCVNWSNHAKQ
ncbi:MAG: DNA topoisomerase I [Candidatus Lokiarchaeota archaeon]|nr:DNA topoisomerase I [Candidatus Lokiarchaeota archaeon]